MTAINQKLYKNLMKSFSMVGLLSELEAQEFLASGAGQSHTFSPFIPVISKDLQISSTSITTAYMIATLFAAFLLPKWEIS